MNPHNPRSGAQRRTLAVALLLLVLVLGSLLVDFHTVVEVDPGGEITRHDP